MAPSVLPRRIGLIDGMCSPPPPSAGPIVFCLPNCPLHLQRPYRNPVVMFSLYSLYPT